MKKKISLSHINEKFNQEVQADFTIAYMGSEKINVLNIIDLGTNYGKRVIAPDRQASKMMSFFEKHWIYHHGAPKSFSADPEFTTDFFQDLLKMHEVECRPRPIRSSSKNVKIERNNGVFKGVLSKVAKEKTSISVDVLIWRASFLTNIFHVSSTMSAFQLARGYSPSIFGVP